VGWVAGDRSPTPQTTPVWGELRGYTLGMTHRVGTKGQVVIPKDLRDELGLQPGAEVEFERDAGAVRILPAGAAATNGLRGRYGSSGLAAALLADREREPR
jgi:AbrB family looped-hinge helix DNA binding protein